MSSVKVVPGESATTNGHQKSLLVACSVQCVYTMLVHMSCSTISLQGPLGNTVHVSGMGVSPNAMLTRLGYTLNATRLLVDYMIRLYKPGKALLLIEKVLK